MIDEKNDQRQDDDLGRRDFVTSVAAGVVAAAGTASGAMMPVTEKDVEIKTPDGTCDAAFIYPERGTHAGVIIWTDVFGLRPSMRGIGKRIAAEGYAVLVPNPYYRVRKAPMWEDASGFSFSSQEDRAKLTPLTASISPDGTIERDAVAYVEFLDAQKQVNKNRKIGTQGYCMGGPLVMRTCAAVPDRIGAGGSFHGGSLVTDKPNSPHLLVPKIKARRMYFAISANDDPKQQGDNKWKPLREIAAENRLVAEFEVYKAQHGWCVPDMPKGPDGNPIYNKPDAEHAWSKLVALYKAGLA